MTRRVQRMVIASGVVLLAALWAWPSLTLAEKTAAHLWGVLASITASLGAMLLLCIACLCRARWAAATHKLLQACALAMPAAALLALPMLATLPQLLNLTELPVKQQAWFAPLPLFIRGIAYLGTWIIASETWRRRSASAGSFDAKPMRHLSAALLPPLAITLTLASIDWVMALAAPWQTTAMGVYVFAGALAAATSVAILGTWAVQQTPMQVAAEHIRSLGRLLFTFNFFWAYIAVGQLLIIVMADLPDEITWYAARSHGSAVVASATLAVGHFVIPFTLLLFERIKRSIGALAVLAVFTLGMHALDMHHLIVPSLREGVQPGFGLLVGLFGVSFIVIATASARWQQLVGQAPGATP